MLVNHTLHSSSSVSHWLREVIPLASLCTLVLSYTFCRLCLLFTFRKAVPHYFVLCHSFIMHTFYSFIQSHFTSEFCEQYSNSEKLKKKKKCQEQVMIKIFQYSVQELGMRMSPRNHKSKHNNTNMNLNLLDMLPNRLHRSKLRTPWSILNVAEVQVCHRHQSTFPFPPVY